VHRLTQRLGRPEPDPAGVAERAQQEAVLAVLEIMARGRAVFLFLQEAVLPIVHAPDAGWWHRFDDF